MFKLRLIKKPILFKLKCDFSFPPIVLANLQEKDVTPTKQDQEIVADSQYDGLSKVIVKPIPDEYIIPEGTIEINSNGIYDVSKEKEAAVNIPEKVLGNKKITKNGIYKASDDNLDGYEEVEVLTSGVDINDYYNLTKRTYGDARYYIKKIPLIDTSSYADMTNMFQYFTSLEEIPLLDTSNVTNMTNMFFNCYKLQKIPLLDTSNVTNMYQTFYHCDAIETIPLLNTSKVVSMTQMFSNCGKLISLPLLDMSNVLNVSGMFSNCYELKDLEGFSNLGQAYKSTVAAKNANYRLTLSFSTKLTEQSIINVLNNLYDIKSNGCNVQSVIFGSTNLAKLTSEEGQQALIDAENKGWEVS